MKKRRKSSERSVRAKKKKNLKKFDPIRVEARDSISETRNSLMSVTVERLSAVFSTRSRFVAQRNARFACLPAGNLCYVIARIPRRNEVERDVLPDRAVREIKMVELFDYFFKKLPLCSIGKANNISDMRLYIFIVVDTSQRGARLGHDHPRLSFPLLRRSRFIVSCR